MFEALQDLRTSAFERPGFGGSGGTSGHPKYEFKFIVLKIFSSFFILNDLHVYDKMVHVYYLQKPQVDRGVIIHQAENSRACIEIVITTVIAA